MTSNLLTLDNIIMLMGILIVAILTTALKSEPEPFKNLIENGNLLYNKHRRLIRKTLQDTSDTLTSRIKTKMRLAGF